MSAKIKTAPALRRGDKVVALFLDDEVEMEVADASPEALSTMDMEGNSWHFKMCWDGCWHEEESEKLVYFDFL